jgi:hypothetical protein
MPEWFVGKPSGHVVSQYALGPAPATPAIIGTVHDAAFQHSPIRFQVLPDGFKAEVIQAAERGQVTGQAKVALGTSRSSGWAA